MVKKELKQKIRAIILSVMLSVTAMASFSTTPLSAAQTDRQQGVNIVSPEFPDAYIIVNEKTSKYNCRGGNQDLGTVTATVFVEEEYARAGNEVVVTSSRLMSKEEVKKIGESNFGNIDRSLKGKAASQSRGKLTITFSGTGSHTKSSSNYHLTGKASWSGNHNNLNSSGTPSVGNDYMGIAWSGGFSYSKPSCTGTMAPLSGKAKIYTADSSPNAGIVWEFMEYANAAGKYQIYVNNVNASVDISKKKLEGNGNTAQAVLKYIHTYQSTTGSISISASSSGVGAGFSLSSTSKQWSIITTVNELYY